MASAGARAYNGGLAAEPPAGSRGRPACCIQAIRKHWYLAFGNMQLAIKPNLLLNR